MNTTLAVHHTSDPDDAFALDLTPYSTDLVTVLLVPDTMTDTDELEDRLAGLIARAERATGAIAVGVIGSEDDMQDQPFDAITRTPALVAA